MVNGRKRDGRSILYLHLSLLSSLDCMVCWSEMEGKETRNHLYFIIHFLQTQSNNPQTNQNKLKKEINKIKINR